MPQYTVRVKWANELFPNVEVNTDEEPMLFKAQLYALTGVQPERQKVILKGMTLKNDDWNIKLRDGAMVLMMGSKEEDVPVEPAVKPVFIEDMNEQELNTALDLPAGLTNLGNTCYLNATVQCLKTVPELREALKGFSGGLTTPGGSMQFIPSQSITAALRDLYEGMDKGSSLPPVVLVQMMHFAFPRFAEKSKMGGFQQQDANECWTELVRMLQQKLPAKDNPDATEAAYKPRSLIEQYFGGTFDTELKCVETEEEPSTTGKEEFLQLSCFISNDVRYLAKGLESKMQEQITKKSEVLGRDAVYTKTSKISRLPAYLTIQFVRFFYKEKESVNAKILKDVKFELNFDAFNLCTKELQNKLTPMREKFQKYEEAQLEIMRSKKKIEKKEEAEEEKKETKKEPFWFSEDLGSNNSGYYELQAVLTHQGRTSSSGHYVAWVRQKGDSWLKCDDESISVVTSEDVLKLSGGGDWHCAYVLLYGPRMLEVAEEPAPAAAAATATVAEPMSTDAADETPRPDAN